MKVEMPGGLLQHTFYHLAWRERAVSWFFASTKH